MEETTKDKHKYTIKIKKQKAAAKTKKRGISSGSPIFFEENERLNEKLVDLLKELSMILMKQGEPFRSRAYKKGQETLMMITEDIKPNNYLEILEGKPGVGSGILDKIREYLKTGTLDIIEKEKNSPFNLFSEIYGVGPKKAQELVDKGIKTISELRAIQDAHLNAVQKIGLHYYDELLERIPRAEIDEYKRIFTSFFGDKEKGDFEIVGSYRRGAESSGDIDVIITGNATSGNALFTQFIDLLIEKKIILEVLSRGDSKCLVIGKLPESKARRVDFLYATPDEYPFSILYFTGSKEFNTVMRAHALSMNYSLNEHGLYHMSSDKKKGTKVSHNFTNEASIFAFLKMEYKTPAERIDGRSVHIIESTVPSNIIIEDKKKSNPTDIKPKQRTRKMRKSTAEEPAVKESIQHFRQNGVSVLSSLSEETLNQMIILSNAAYYNLDAGSSALLTDNEYDILKEYIERKYPKNTVVREIGAPVEKNKVTLPYQMPSMDKIKPDSGALDSWKQKYKGAYVLSCKLDGVSGMYSTESSTPKLYTRGNGKVGQDITHLLDHLKLPVIKDCVVRGEFIMPKRVFQDKYQTTFANARNLVAGIVNRITADEKTADLHFVAYEVIKPIMIPSEQMKFLKNNGFETVKNMVESAITNPSLSETLVSWRTGYEYEIDGVIVANDAVYERQSGNPDHAFAFKMVLSDQMAEVKVVDVLWNASKDGYLKPRVQIEPVKLAGVTIEYATGFNAAFIETHKIGVGAIIKLIRSGDVIPHIKEVIAPAERAKMPDVPYKWNDTHVDIVLENLDDDSAVLAKNITGFFRGIEVEGLSAGNMARIIEAGFNSVSKIIHMTKADFLTIEGFKDKTATKLHDGIAEKLGAASLITVMASSNLFGRGFSDKKIDAIMTEVGSGILTSIELPVDKVKRIAAIKGMSVKTAEPFVDAIPKFLEFMRECGLERKLTAAAAAAPVNTEHALFKKSIVMSGKRDKDLEAALLAIGATLGSSVSKNTFAVISDDIDSDTGKVSAAKTLGIPLFTPDGFRKKYLA